MPTTNSPRILITDPALSPPAALSARSPRAIKSSDPGNISTSPLAFTTLGPSVLGAAPGASRREREREREMEAENRERQRAQDLESAMSMCMSPSFLFW